MARQAASRRSAGARRSGHSSRSSNVLVLIGIFKLLKALLLVAVGIGALRLLHHDIAASVLHWERVVRVDPDNRFLHGILVKALSVTPKQLEELSLGTFVYAGLFATEGLGLVLRKRWGEYFTIATTGGFIPLEVYELFRHFTAVKVAFTLLNVVIVFYLVWRVRSR